MRSSKLRKGRGPCVRLRLYLRLELGRGKRRELWMEWGNKGSVEKRNRWREFCCQQKAVKAFIKLVLQLWFELS